MIHIRAWLLLAVLLQGCASVPTGVPDQGCPAATCNRAAITDWQLRGRLSLTRGEQGWHAGLNWDNHADHFRLQVTGPLGQGALQLSGDASGVSLVDADGNLHEASDADSLLLQLTGWEMPVSGLRYWVRGLSEPDRKVATSLDQNGRLQQLQQSGWTIRYQRYRQVDGMSWPDKLLLTRDDLSLRIVVDQWQLGAGVP